MDKQKSARENHCEIERRRRIKMASYFNDLCEMIPACFHLSKRPDKLTILKMATNHISNLNASINAIGGFRLSIYCNTGRLIFISPTVQNCLNFKQADYYSATIFDAVAQFEIDSLRKIINNGVDFLSDSNNLIHSDFAQIQTTCFMKVGDFRLAGYSDDEQQNRSNIRKSISKCFNSLYDLVHIEGLIVVNTDEDATHETQFKMHCIVHLANPSNGLLKSIVNQDQSFTCICSERAEIKSVSDRCINLIGIKPIDLIGHSIFDICRDEDRHEINLKLLQCLSNMHTNEGYVVCNDIGLRNQISITYILVKIKLKCIFNPGDGEFMAICCEIIKNEPDGR
ncbi:hypothetical protein GJ496_003670 [Pomphorhynchus laevis]|nr:hypothetical protein GJ496_003670 [Pomphorhynchus laevis]